jgi:hypothetical protein
MKSQSINNDIALCRSELDSIIVSTPLFGVGGSIISYLTKYAIIRACGTVERSFKSIIYDKASNSVCAEVDKYLENTIIDSSINPSLDNINRLLARFGGQWNQSFKDKMRGYHQKEKDSLQSLVDLRNEFAHGGNPVASIQSIKEYFDDSVKILEALDTIIV